jgi:DNA-binding IclR family transcriptional regulator
VLDALSATGGATLAEIVTLTGWQPHTARAALTGLRRRGFAVTLTADDAGRKAYRARQGMPA